MNEFSTKVLNANERYLTYLLLPMGFLSFIFYSKIEVSTFLVWIFRLVYCFIVCRLIIQNYSKNNNKDLRFLNFFLGIILISFVRGLFEISNYWETKYFIEASFCVILITSVYVFNISNFLRMHLRFYLKKILIHNYYHI